MLALSSVFVSNVKHDSKERLIKGKRQVRGADIQHEEKGVGQEGVWQSRCRLAIQHEEKGVGQEGVWQSRCKLAIQHEEKGTREEKEKKKG